MTHFYKLSLLALCGGFGLLGAQSTSGSTIFLKLNGGAEQTYTLDGTANHPQFSGANLGSFGNRLGSIVVTGGDVKYVRGNYPTYPTSADLQCTVFDLNNNPRGNTMTLGLSGSGFAPTDWSSHSGKTNMITTNLGDGTYHLSCRFHVVNGGSGDAYSPTSGALVSANFTIDNKLAVNETENEQQNFVTDGQLYTQDRGPVTIEVYDYSGRIIKTLQTTATAAPIELGIAERGQYILVIKNSQGKERSIKFLR